MGDGSLGKGCWEHAPQNKRKGTRIRGSRRDLKIVISPRQMAPAETATGSKSPCQEHPIIPEGESESLLRSGVGRLFACARLLRLVGGGFPTRVRVYPSSFSWGCRKRSGCDRSPCGAGPNFSNKSHVAGNTCVPKYCCGVSFVPARGERARRSSDVKEWRPHHRDHPEGGY